MSNDLGLSRTLAERTAEAIRNRILTLAQGYHPGQRLYPDHLAEDLGVSITPVREAFRLLNNEGLVDLLPRRAVRVANLSPDEIADLTAVRGGVEMLAVRMRGGCYSAGEIHNMNSCLDICEKAIANRDVRAYRRNDTEFHRLLVQGSKSPTLVALYEQLHKRAQILELYFSDNWEAYSESLLEHRAIAGLLSTGPMSSADETLWTHWAHSRARISQMFSRVSETADKNGGGMLPRRSRSKR